MNEPVSFEVRYACERGHAQTMTFGPGFRRAQVELHAWLMIGSPMTGGCLWDRDAVIGWPDGAEPPESNGPACGLPLSATIRALPHGEPVAFNTAKFRLSRTRPGGGPDLPVERCEWCGLELPDDPAARGAWMLQQPDRLWTCVDCRRFFGAYPPSDDDAWLGVGRAMGAGIAALCFAEHGERRCTAARGHSGPHTDGAWWWSEEGTGR